MIWAARTTWFVEVHSMAPLFAFATRVVSWCELKRAVREWPPGQSRFIGDEIELVQRPNVALGAGLVGPPIRPVGEVHQIGPNLYLIHRQVISRDNFRLRLTGGQDLSGRIGIRKADSFRVWSISTLRPALACAAQRVPLDGPGTHILDCHNVMVDGKIRRSRFSVA